MEQMDAESKRLSQIMDTLKNRNFPSTKMKQGVRVQVQFQDRRDATDMDRDVIVDRINRQTPRGKIVQSRSEATESEGISPSDKTVPEMEEESPDEREIPTTSIVPVSQPDKTIPTTKKLSKITIVEPIYEEEAEEPVEEAATVKTSKPRITQKKSRAVSFMPSETPKEIIKITTSPYYMSNRKRFLEKINQLFEPFMQELAKTQEQISCSTLKSMGAAGQEVELLIHQRVAREYLNLYSPYRGLLLFFGLGTGKCLKKDTPILMYDGNIKVVQDIQVGELLMGDDSLPRTVNSLARGRDKMYDIIPIKGEKYTVNQEHILCLKASGFPKICFNNYHLNHNYQVHWIENNKFRTKAFIFQKEKSNQEEQKKNAQLFFDEQVLMNKNRSSNVFEIAVKDYLQLSKKTKAFLKGYRVPIDFSEKELPFDPYMIGYWLGDGSSYGPAISCQDSTVLHYFVNQLPQYKLSIFYQSQYNYGISGTGRIGGNALLNTLKQFNMIKNKHIPYLYKCNSRENRLKLLAGIIDSDGSYSKGGFEFSQKNENLMNDVIYLARSLGFACYKHYKKTTWTYKDVKNEGSAWRINISGHGIEQIPTKIPRKQASCRKQNKDVLSTGITVNYVGEDDYYGFTIDGNCRFVLGDFTVTHNTTASISIAEGMKSHKKICVMTPASLKMNFFTELKRAGDPLYKKNQSWSFVSTAGQPDLEDILSKKMSLSLDFIRKKKGVWMAETEPTSAPFSELSEEDQIAVDKQLDQMIRAKYLDINYNGINHRMMSELTENYTKNPFDNTVIVIDEVHNLVNMIVNQISRLSKKSENVPTKIGPSTPISLLLYEYIMQAHDARVVFLSGTPIINTPNEIGVLYNMLRGYIKTWTFSLQINTTAKITTETILQMFHKEKFLLLDYVEYSQNKLTITRNPFGFINNTTGKCNSKSSRASAVLEKDSQKVPTTATAKKDDDIDADIAGEPEALAEGFPLTIPTPKKTTRKITTTLPKGQRKTKKVTITEPRDAFPTPNTMVVESEKDEDIYNMDPHEGGGGGGNEDVDPNYQGVCLDETGNMDDSKFLAKVKDILKRNGLQVLVTPKVDLFKCLPDRMDAFLDMFIDIDTGMMKQSDMFSRRILGLTSFFKSPQENLLPTLEETDAGESYELVKTEMSTYQFEQYAVIRKEERDKDTNVQKNKKKRGATSGAENTEGLYREFTSTYRIYSRSCCNFAWPDPPGRPITSTKPDKGKLLKSMAEELPISEISEMEDVEKQSIQKSVPSSMKNTQPTKKSLKSSMVVEEESDDSLISEIPEKQSIQKSVLPTLKNTQPTKKSLKSSMVEEEESDDSPISEIPEKQNVPKSVLPSSDKTLLKSMEEEDEEEEDIRQKGGMEEEDINLEDMGSKQEKDDEGEISELQVEEAMKQLNQEAFLALSNLSTYSPKYAAILENILSEKHIGLHLVYSSFRTLEGIGIFQLVLENNGFRRFHIQKMADGEWDIEDDILGQPTYALYTGTESTEEKEIIRNIYNGAWDNVPPRIVKKLEAQDKDGKKNTVGDIIKILMITASGAEGINLKNTRYVHIVEPYWNMVRVDQVVGRARRICSHEELPPELRTVKVFLYLSVFSEQQKTDKNYVDLMNSDVSRFNENQPVTTDETLYEISLKKENISKQILNVVKTSSIDCALYQSQGSKEMICYGANLGHIKTNDFLSYPTLNQDAQVQNKQVVTKQRVSFREITIKGKKYHLNESDMNLYEHSEYMANRTNPEKMKSVGKLVKEGKGYKIAGKFGT
jgi:hypothetical protein